ncbi:MAG TPA: hypothetical protein VKU19_14255 [Bryobacteraceae bacterium]|nr:hypothetical protein [Bryobacteraceae bacterium]
MRWLCGVWILGAAMLTGAESVHTVVATVDLVRGQLGEHKKDGQIASSLHKWKLCESLDEHTVEELQSLGAGPKTTEELERLRMESVDYPAPKVVPKFDSPPVPSAEEQARVVAQARAIALNYTDSLPDFIAVESIRRYSDEHGPWRLKDTLTIKLSYFEKSEDYKVLTVNGHPSMLSYEAVGGTITQGEFGSLLREVFEPRSKADLHWDHWTNLRGRPANVFFFRVHVDNSRYQMVVGNRGERQTITAGQHGYVYVDRETSQIVHIFSEAESIPDKFPVRNSSTSLDYGFADVGGKQFLLPLRAVVRMGTASLQTRNEVEFHSYRKFGAESSISFGDAVPDKPAKE